MIRSDPSRRLSCVRHSLLSNTKAAVVHCGAWTVPIAGGGCSRGAVAHPFSSHRGLDCRRFETEVSATAAEQKRFGSSVAAVRHLTKVIKHKSQAQNELYAQCLVAAEQLQPKTFVEVESAETIESSPSPLLSMPLSGTVVAVSDAIDVDGFSTRYDVTTKMLHKLPKVDHPFITWLRLHGARISGKLVGASPLCYEELSDLSVHSAAIAVEKKACHYAVLNSFIGAAGVTACTRYDVVTFKPACNSFENGASRFSSSCGSMTVMASRIDDIMYLWEVYTGTHRKIEELSSKYSNEPKLAKMASEVAQHKGGTAGDYEQAAQFVAEAVTSPPTLLGSLKRRLLVSHAGGGLARSFASFFFRPREQHVHAFTSSWQQRREGVLKVGIPVKLVDLHCSYLDSLSEAERNSLGGLGAALGSSVSPSTVFEARLRYLYETRRKARAASGQRPKTEEEANALRILNSDGEIAGSSSSSAADELGSSGADSSVGGSRDSESSSGSLNAIPSVGASASGSKKKSKRASSWRATWQRLWTGSDLDSPLPASAGHTNKSAGMRDYRIDFIPVHMNIDLDNYVRSIQKITNYELAAQIGREVSLNSRLQQPSAKVAANSQTFAGAATDSSSGSGGGASVASSTTGTMMGGAYAVSPPSSLSDTPINASLFGTGFFEELPQSLVSTLYDAKNISAADYQATLQLTAERTSSTIDEVFVDVDILCLPILCDPCVHMNVRSSSFLLPFVKNGNPLFAMKLSKNLSVILVGELGRSTQLLEDVISFADHVKGEAPAKWWRRALFGTEGSRSE